MPTLPSLLYTVRFAFSALLAFCLCYTNGYAEIYKWVDEQGKTHYGNQPGNDQAQSVPVTKAPPVDANWEERQARQQRISDNMAMDSQALETERQTALEQHKQQQAKCKEAQQQLKDYENATYLYDPNPKNSTQKNLPLQEKRIYSYAERQQIIADAKAAVAHWCKGINKKNEKNEKN